ncbi:protein rep [Clostridium estertheticum]|uniref:protein rep n=1 Tax=Clostridium estertheticum TaxID=238834 RepID=UPI001CF3C5F1|nr:protein rep [Clostridium estertheticum]MCB2309458.1 protein rep [Clostridium estertheticum]MCB2347900.1 protein rep [Clostridium estertheticum]MCB2352411.1 protein rep [Clostridium estertheticum]WAG48579.1 protein rep [Clostridium estertheticum]
MEKYTMKKTKSPVFVNYIVKHVSVKAKERLKTCGDFIMFLGDKTMEKLKIKAGDFCGNRFCPMCAWRKAKKDGLIISILMQYLKIEQKKEFIFLTLTTPNVQDFELENEIKKFNNSFKKLMKRTEVLKITKGYIRKLEVTYDKNEKITKQLYEKKKNYFDKRYLEIGDENPTFNSYNPHFHVVIAVNKTYFTDTKQYINQERWLDLWREATGDSSITQVSAKKVRANDRKEVSELAKYGAKDADYLTSQSVFDVFYKALKGKQILTYNGLFKDALKLFKEGKLDKYKEKDPTEYIFMLLYKWGFGQYVEQEIRELTQEEYDKVNKELIQEIEIED